MSNSMRRLRERVIDRALNGPGTVPGAGRSAAFENVGVDERARALVEKVARHAWNVTREDVATVKAAGVPEDEIFELVVCAALGQATRQMQSVLVAVEEAMATDVDPAHSAGQLHGGGR